MLKMKKLLAVLVCMAMVMAAAPCVALAEVQADGEHYAGDIDLNVDESNNVQLMSAITVYYQGKEQPWSNYSYNYGTTIAEAGCGLLALTNAVYNLNGNFLEPTMLADFSIANGYRIKNQGTAWAFFQGAAKKYGPEYGFSYSGQTSSISTVKKHLQNGGVTTCNVPGHFMAITSYDDSSGKYLLLDSAPSSKRGTTSGYAWKTEAQLSSLGVRAYFMLSSTVPDPIRPNATCEVCESTESGELHVAGWAYDPDNTSATVAIRVYVGEDADCDIYEISADNSRDDVGLAFGVGNYHGFDDVIQVERTGNQLVRVFAIDTNGENHSLIWNNVQYIAPVNHPRGFVDAIEGGEGEIKVAGWVFDEDDLNASISVHVYVNDQAYSFRADKERSDVDEIMHAGKYHGYEGTIEIEPGTYNVRVFGINEVGKGSNMLLGQETVTVTPKTNVERVTLSQTEATLNEGDSIMLTATVFPDNASNKNVTWKSDNDSAATVKNGVVKATGAGRATISVTTEDGGKTAECKVTVKPKAAPKYSAKLTVGRVNAVPGGRVTVPISISENPGIAGFNFTVNFDKRILTPVSIAKGGALTAGTLTSNIQQGGDMKKYNYVTAYWSNPSDFKENGEILLLTFDVDKNASGNSQIIVTCANGDVSNQNYEDVDIKATVGGVSVDLMSGDIFSDGIVNTKDGVRLNQYLAKWDIVLSQSELAAADVVKDDVVNTKDGVKLSQYLAKWDVTLQAASEGEGRAAFKVGDVETYPGETVEVPVMITENTGMAGFNLTVSYDRTKLTPQSITKGEALSEGTLTSNIQQGGDMGRFDNVTAYWSNPSNVTSTGTAFTITFLVGSDAAGTLPISLSYDKSDVPCDQNLNELKIEIADGGVTITEDIEPNPEPIPEPDTDIYTINALTGEMPESGTFYAEVNVTKNLSHEGEDAVVIAVYKDGKLMEMTYMRGEFAKGQTVTFGGRLTAVPGAMLKAFVWDDLDSMEPLGNTVEK